MEQPNSNVGSSDNANSSENDESVSTYHQILHDIGEFGLYQILVALAVGFGSAYGSLVTMNFIFAVDLVEHRCWIPECEPNNSGDFSADWLGHAIPYTDGRLDTCSRYESIGSIDGSCTEHTFNRSQIVACNGFIWKNNEQRLLSHLDMACTGHNNKLALLGTASMLGRTLAMPIGGMICDKFGRLITMTVSTLLGAIFSALQALPSNLMYFELYLAFEFLASLLSTGMIAAGYIFNMEWTTAKYRVRISSISVVLEALMPYVGLGLAAWYFAEHFIAYRLVAAAPGLLMLAFHLILGESPQWLLAKHQSARAIGSIAKAAKLNGKPLHARTIQRIERLAATPAKQLAESDRAMDVTIVALLREKTLAFRLVITSLVWMLMYFAYNVMFFQSTRVNESKYLSFALIGLADIPGTLLNEVLLNRIGRRWTVGLTLPVYSAMLLAATQLPAGQETVRLALFVIGKAAITAACVAFNTFAAEFWPTSIRGTATNIGRTSAQVGSICASLTVLLRDYHAYLPVFLSASAGVVGTILVFAFLPETMHCGKLPDTMEEALAIGRSSKRESKPINPDIVRTIT